MLRKIESLIPPFLKQIDRQLLLTRPGLWVTKFHYLLFFGAIAFFLLGSQALFSPVHTDALPNPEFNFWFVIVPALIGLGLWMYRVSLFKVEDRFGKTFRGKHLRDQFIYASGILVLALLPFMFSQIQSNKIASVVSEQELAEDINTLNIGRYYFPQNEEHFRVRSHRYYPNEIYRQYEFDYFGEKVYNTGQVKLIHSKRKSKRTELMYISEFQRVYQKYGGELPQYGPERYLDRFRSEKISLLENDYIIFDNIERIIEAKNRNFFFQEKQPVNLAIFFAFTLWLVSLTFLQSNIRSMLLTIGLGLGLFIAGSIITGVYVEFFHPNSPAIIAILFYTILTLLLIQSFRRKNTVKQNSWKTISLTLATWMTPLVPLVFSLFQHNQVSEEGAFGLLNIGMVCAFLIWNRVYQPRFAELSSMPKDN